MWEQNTSESQGSLRQGAGTHSEGARSASPLGPSVQVLWATVLYPLLAGATCQGSWSGGVVGQGAGQGGLVVDFWQS